MFALALRALIGIAAMVLMGMFDKDKQFAPDGRLDEVYPPGPTDSREGPELVLWAVEDRGKFATELGDADMTWLTVSDVLTPEDKKVIGTLSKPIHEKAAEAEPEKDFPAVVRCIKVSTDFNDAMVLQWIRAYDDGQDGKLIKAWRKEQAAQS